MPNMANLQAEQKFIEFRLLGYSIMKGEKRTIIRTKWSAEALSLRTGWKLNEETFPFKVWKQKSLLPVNLFFDLGHWPFVLTAIKASTQVSPLSKRLFRCPADPPPRTILSFSSLFSQECNVCNHSKHMFSLSLVIELSAYNSISSSR